MSNMGAVYQKEIDWLLTVINNRINDYLDLEDVTTPIISSPPKLDQSDSHFENMINKHQLNTHERLMIALCLTHILSPRLLDVFLVKNIKTQRRFTEFGGCLDHEYACFSPTGETLLFLLGGREIQDRLQGIQLLQSQSKLIAKGILQLGPATIKGKPESGIIQLSPRYYSLLILREKYKPQFSSTFPALLLETNRSWEELILPPGALQKLLNIRQWIKQKTKILNTWDMASKLRPGYRSLFYGPPGTGKTMAAALIGKLTDHPVYRVDLSRVVSKYIGETEKNLSNVFEQAEHQKWILFFDEADALFGKRTEVNDAHDRFANQEVAYLLQRLENFNGIVILASNMRKNMDNAFTRRFESIIYFPMPHPTERLQLWHQSFPQNGKASIEPELQEVLPTIAEKYELTGGSIINVVRYALLQAAAQQEEMQTDIASIKYKDVMKGIRVEYGKMGRSL